MKYITLRHWINADKLEWEYLSENSNAIQLLRENQLIVSVLL